MSTNGGRRSDKLAVINERLIKECVYIHPTAASEDDRSKNMMAFTGGGTTGASGGGGRLLGDANRNTSTTAGSQNAAAQNQQELFEVSCLMFSYKCIMKIDNLVGVDNLTKLYLDNNNISKIENLSHLKHLQWLDLSFNHIKEIENLEELTLLENLSLYSNEISTVKGLDTLTNLRCLSLGKNNIDNLDSVARYLHRFKSLRMLTLTGNKVESQSRYKACLLSFIPKLRYLDGRQCFTHEIEKARESFKELLLAVDERDKKEEKEAQDAKSAAETAAEYQRANVPNEVDFVEEILTLEPEGRASIRAVLESDTLKEKAKDVVEPHRDRIKQKAEELATRMKDIRRRKDTDAHDFYTTLSAEKKACDDICKTAIKEFEKEVKKVIPFGLKAKPDPETYDEAALAQLRDSLAELKSFLLEKEADQMDAYDAVIQTYEDVLLNYKVEAQETLANNIEEIRQLEKQFHLDIKIKFDGWYDDRQRMQQDNADIFSSASVVEQRDKQLLAILDNKDEYSKTLSDWAELHVKRLDEKEEFHKKKEEEEAKVILTKNIDEEHARNRSRIAQIHAYVERMSSLMDQWEQMMYDG